MSHWSGTLELIRQTLVAAPAWVVACDDLDPAGQVIVGMAGHAYEGEFLSATAGAKGIALPLAQIGLGQPTWEPDGHRRWQRAGTAVIDVAQSGEATPDGYLAAVQLAEDLMDAFRAASDLGTMISDSLSVAGPPLRVPRDAPPPFRNAWTFRLSVGWTIK